MNARNYAMLILELNDFLVRRSPDTTKLTGRERRLLKQGIEFLRRAIVGYEISSKQSLVPDLVPLVVYSFAINALHTGTPKIPDLDKSTEQELFGNSIEVLEQIESGMRLPLMPQDRVEKTRQLFNRLTQFAFSENLEADEPGRGDLEISDITLLDSGA
jgi:hypothetical protein